MEFFRKIADYLSKEFAKIKALSPDERKWYIWEYHRLHIFGVVCALCVFLSLLGNWLWPTNIYLNNAAINLIPQSSVQYAPLTTDVQEDWNLGKREPVILSPFYFFFEGNTQTDQLASMESFLVRIAARDLDLLFMRDADYFDMNAEGLYCDLEQLLPNDLWQAVKEYAIYVTDPATGTEIPGALDITHVPQVESCQFVANTVVVCISPTSQHLDKCCEMIAYLFGVG